MGWGWLLILVSACAISTGGVASRALPEWVERGGASDEFPNSRFVTGFGESRDRESAVESAKQWAAADLTRQISVRIQSGVVDSYREMGDEIEESLSSRIQARTDIRLDGIRYEIHRKGRVVWALAVLERLPAALARRRSRDRSLEMAEACLRDAAVYEAEDRIVVAAATYHACRATLQQALEDEAIALALTRGRLSNDDGGARLAAAFSRLETRLRSLPHDVASSIREAAENLATQLSRAGIGRGRALRIPAFAYGDRDVSSSFGREVAMALEAAIGGVEEGPAPPAHANGSIVLWGSYREEDEGIRIRTIAREIETGNLLASAEVLLARSAVPEDLETKPANLSSYLRDADKLGGGEIVSGDLRLEIRTNKGARGLVFEEGEELVLYARVNQPAWLRLIYVLTNGAHVSIEQDWYIDASKVNRLVEYRERFEIVRPFGVEMIHAMAFTKRPPPLDTRPARIDGESYVVVVGGADQVMRDRALARRERDPIAEQTLQLTTIGSRAID